MECKLVIIDACIIIDAIHSGAENHDEAHKLLERVKKENYKIVMPMHGFFEIQSTFKRISRIEGLKVESKYNSELKAIKITPVAIDKKFIENYYDVEVPYAKAGDTIYMVIAKKLGLPLITRDNKMYKVAKEAGINVFTVSEAVNA